MSIINKDGNICVSVDRNDVSVCGRKLSRCSNNEEHMAEGETEDLVHEVICNCFLFFYLSYTPTCKKP